MIALQILSGMVRLLKRFKALLTLSNLIAVLVLLLTISVFWFVQVQTHSNVFSEEGFKTLATSLGWWGPLLYALLVAIAVVVSQIPGVPLTIAAGALWGPFPALIYSVLGGFTGAMIAYFLGRTLGRSIMKVFVGKVMIFDKERGEWFIGLMIFVSRILPLFPFDIISYAAGVSGLSVGVYALTTLLGMIPSTLLLTYLGSAFTVSLPFALSISALASVMLVIVPLIIRRYNWLGLRDSIRLE
jgi:uncharacterized membrane protein YdjX (TVP38/TMEM64 family)